MTAAMKAISRWKERVPEEPHKFTINTWNIETYERTFQEIDEHADRASDWWLRLKTYPFDITLYSYVNSSTSPSLHPLKSYELSERFLGRAHESVKARVSGIVGTNEPPMIDTLHRLQLVFRSVDSAQTRILRPLTDLPTNTEPVIESRSLIKLWRQLASSGTQLRAVSSLFADHWQHMKYLREVSTREGTPLITRATASKALRAWFTIFEASSFRMPVPAACTGPDGQMFYGWDSGRHHLELEIIPDDPAEFFYRDRETEQLWGEDYVVGDPLSAEVVEKLKFFL